jgi:hypothetical protein
LLYAYLTRSNFSLHSPLIIPGPLCSASAAQWPTPYSSTGACNARTCESVGVLDFGRVRTSGRTSDLEGRSRDELWVKFEISVGILLPSTVLPNFLLEKVPSLQEHESHLRNTLSIALMCSFILLIFPISCTPYAYGHCFPDTPCNSFCQAFSVSWWKMELQ